MRLQSQEGRNDQMKFVRWFQQGYIEITTNLTRALAGYFSAVIFPSVVAY